MLSDNQTQKVDGGSMAIQAAGNVNVGLTYNDARRLFLDLQKGYIAELTGEAIEVAKARIAKFTDDLVQKMADENPASIEQARDPGFQAALLAAQRGYAGSGHEQLGDMLVDLLADRAKNGSHRNMTQLVLDQALHVVPMLTDEQMATLGLLFLLRHTQRSIKNPDDFRAYLEQYLQPLASAMATDDLSFRHLEYAGCGTQSALEVSLLTVFSAAYAGLFMKGMDGDHITQMQIPVSAASLLCGCFDNPGSFQIAALNIDVLGKKLDALEGQISEDLRAKFISEFSANIMDDDAIGKRIVEMAPFMSDVLQRWSTSGLKHCNLTSVGIALGHATVRRVTGDRADLTVWIK